MRKLGLCSRQRAVAPSRWTARTSTKSANAVYMRKLGLCGRQRALAPSRWTARTSTKSPNAVDCENSVYAVNWENSGYAGECGKRSEERGVGKVCRSGRRRKHEKKKK